MFLRLKSLIAVLSITAAAGASVLPHAAFAQAKADPAATTQAAAATAAPVVLAQADTSEPGVSATTSRETVENPYGLGALWAQGDFVAKGTLLILVLFSIGSWYILVTKLYESFKLSREAQDARKNFFKAANLEEGAGKLKQGSAFRFVAESGITASNHHEGELTEHIDRNTWITTSVQRSVDEVQARLQNGLAFLATVGSTAPFIGLFGTVWGIYHALTAIGIAGQASIDKVAGPVGEALIMTAIGLAVAVPAVLGYNWLVRRNKVTLDAVRGFGADLHGVLIGAKAAR